MDHLPSESAYRLALLLSRERAGLEEQMVQAAQGVSPLYAFMPAFLLRHWCHEVMSAIIAGLVEADFGSAQAYAVTVLHFTQRVGRSPELIRRLVGVWSDLISALIDAEFAADPAIHAETQAILQMLLELADQALTTVYGSESAARELLP